MTTTAQGAAKVAEANRQASTGQVGGAVTSSGQIVGAGGKVLGGANIKDTSSYTPGSSVDDKVGPITQASADLTKAIAPDQLDPNSQVPDDLAKQVTSAQGVVNQIAQNKGVSLQKTAIGYNAVPDLKSQYTQAKSAVDNSGVPSPQNMGGGMALADKTMSTLGTPGVPQAVTDYLNPDNKAVSESMTQLYDILNPKAERDMLAKHIDQLASDRATLSGLKADLMDTKRVMAGTDQDIRDEVTKAGGFASESQVQALTIARNKTLLQKAQLLSDQIQSATDLVNSDVSLVGDEKQLASQQFTQRMSLLNYQQQNNQNAYNALKDSYKTMIENNPAGLYNSLLTDPAQAQRFQAVTGLTPDMLKGLASTKATEVKLKEAQLQGQLLENRKKGQEISDNGGSQTITAGQAPTGKADYTAAGYANRALESVKTLDRVGGKFADPSAIGGTTVFGIGIPNALKSSERQQFEQASRNFLNAVLRKESGAAISPDEFKSGQQQYFPQPGDSDAVILQKAVNRVDSLNALIGAAGKAYSGKFIPHPFMTKEGIIITDY